MNTESSDIVKKELKDNKTEKLLESKIQKKEGNIKVGNLDSDNSEINGHKDGSDESGKEKEKEIPIFTSLENNIDNLNISKASNEGCCATLNKQIKLMIWKNYLIFKRSLKLSIFQLIVPIIICIVLVIMNAIVTMYSNQQIIHDPTIYDLISIPKCMYPDNCTTIGYGIAGNVTEGDPRLEKIYSIMSYVSEVNNLTHKIDVKLLTIGKSSDFTNYLSENLNKTKFGVVFCIDQMDFYNQSIPCNFEFDNQTFEMYNIMYNISNVDNGFLGNFNEPLPTDRQLLQLKLSIDNAYMDYYAKIRSKPVPKISVQTQAFPSTSNRLLQGADIIGAYGPFYFFFPPVITFVTLLLEIVREKDMKLRKSLLIIGLKSSAHWVSWFVVALIFSTAISIVLIITGCICQFDVFLKSPIPVTFLIFFLFTLSMVFLGFFLSTILKSTKSAYTASYGFILIGLVMEVFLTNVVIIQYLYSLDIPSWVKVIRFCFSLYPPFNFSKCFSDISQKAGSHFDTYQFKWIYGNGYSWSDFVERQKGQLRGDVFYDIPSTAETLFYLVLDILFFAVLTFYFDHVSEGNRGRQYNKLFFLEKQYWYGTEKKILPKELKQDESEKKEDYIPVKNSNSLKINSSKENSSIDIADVGLHSVELEKEKIMRLEELNKKFTGLRILGIKKEFLLAEKCCGKKLLKALNETYLDIPQGELLTILGHNGAGKTTLINVLTGNLSPTAGTARINNYDLLLETDMIENLVGLCPQHDILWEELTATEHIELYGYLRGIPKEKIPELIEQKLNEVNLTKQSHHQIRTFSGGMRRRMSILLSTIGDPKVIFLDEPTTGLDPVNKRFIWSMIQNIKKERSVILTTHSMEEADFLSDRIGVIKEGTFKCFGTPLELKNTFGTGYLLTFICEQEKADEVKRLLNDLLPSCKHLNSSGGSIILNLPFNKVIEMKYFIMILNNNYNHEKLKPLKGLIKECGMDYTTIEEIFLKITSNKTLEESVEEVPIK